MSVLITAGFLFSVDVQAQQDKATNIKDSTTAAKTGESAKSKEEENGEITAKRQKELDSLKKRIRFSFSTDRRQAIQAVRRLKPNEREQFYDLLIDIGSDDKDNEVRSACVRFLADYRVEKAQALFVETIQEEDEDAIREALRGIQRTKHTAAATVIFEQLKEKELTENDTIAITMIRTLGALESKLAVEMLTKAIDDPSTHSEIRRTATLYFGSVQAKSALEKLKELLTDSNEDITVRAYAANSIGKMNDLKYAPDLKDILQEIRDIRTSRERARYNGLKQQAIVALVRLGDDSVKEELYAAAKDDDPNTRVRAIRHMGELQLEEFRDFLEYKSENDESRSVMATAKTALNKLDGIEDDSAELELEQEDENE